jgi:hypothetical protein
MNESARASIEGLPSELLVSIANFSRPNSFESFMLSSKTIHAAGSGLIKDHNFCKRWDDCNALHTSRHLHTCAPISTFQRLLEAPRSVRPWLLEYKSKVFICYYHFRHWEGQTFDVMSRVRTQLPWIVDEYLYLLAQFPSLFHDFESSDSLARYFEGRDSTISEKDLGPLCALLLLLLCSNCRILVIHEPQVPPGSSCISRLSQLNGHNIGHPILPDLSTIHVDHAHRRLEKEMAHSLFSFQRLENLVLGQLVTVSRHSQNLTDLVSSPVPQSTCEEYSPMLRQLILRKAIILPDDMLDLLMPLVYLESLLLEIRPYTHDIKPVREEGEIWPPQFRGADFVLAIARCKGNSLKHLSLTIWYNRSTFDPIIDPFQHISGFHDFAALTHLEFDACILCGTKEIVLNLSEPHWIPIPIWQALPSSIQVVRIIVHRVTSHILYGLLRDTPFEKNKFASLRKIVLRLSRNGKPSCSAQALEPVQFLLDAVIRLGVEVDVQETNGTTVTDKSSRLWRCQ